MSHDRWNDLEGRSSTLGSGHLACPGCGCMPAYNWALKTLGKKTITVTPACCFAVIDGPFPYSASGVPFLHSAFEASASYASGVRAALDVTGQEDVTVLVWAGDGGTFDIGIQSLSAAAERGENLLYVCYDNEAYMNTGIQRSSATPQGAWTTTTPAGHTKREPKKNIGEILAAHRIAYFASMSLSHPDDMVRKLEHARATKGFRFLHYYCPCPTGWKADSRHMVELARLAVETGTFPLYEVFGGDRWVVNHRPSWAPMADYVKLQGRFSHLTKDEITGMEQEARAGFARIDRRVEAPAPQAAPA